MGGKDQQPAAWSKKTGFFYVPTNNQCMDYRGLEVDYVAGAPYVGADVRQYAGPGGNLGEFMAWDPIKGEKVWGIKERFAVWGGALVTAGDVVFYGTMDGWFKAADARSGAVLWKTKLPSGIIGDPMSFEGPDGRQYVAVYSGVGGWPGLTVATNAKISDTRMFLGAAEAYKDLPMYTRRGRLAARLRAWASGGEVSPGASRAGGGEGGACRLGARFGLPLRSAHRGRVAPALALLAWACLALAPARPSLAEPSNAAAQGELRVCADPNNLPFSNRRQAGFENRIARILARELGASLRYHWIPLRRGWVRRAMQENDLCDVAIGVPAGDERLLTTRAYYRSTYVFVQRQGRPWRIRSLDDPELHGLRIGVHLAGNDYANTPPAHALSRRGLVRNVVGYSLMGDYAEADPPARLIEAVAKGEVDVAVAWGPIAGFFAARQGVPLEVAPVMPAVDLPVLPFVYDIAIGVRHTEGLSRYDDAPARRVRDALDVVLRERRFEIEAVLRAYEVPLIDAASGSLAQGG